MIRLRFTSTRQAEENVCKYLGHEHLRRKLPIIPLNHLNRRKRPTGSLVAPLNRRKRPTGSLVAPGL